MINLFVDADDTILNSSATIIGLLNQKHEISPPKTIEDLRDWSYRSIYKKVSDEEISKIYSSEVFFEKVQIVEEFKNILNKYEKILDITIVSAGDIENLDKKKKYFNKKLPKCKFIGIVRNEEEDKKDKSYSKKTVNMKGGIQIDDRFDCLDTNAACKILLKDKGDFYWNNSIGSNIENLYVLKNWGEIEKTIGFFINHKEFLKGYNDDDK